MSVRLRRLQADYNKMCTLFSQKSRIRIKKTLGDPPEKYQVEYLVSGMEKTLDGRLIVRNNFLVEVTLTGSYPRLAPQCRMLTPVFHPNIAPHAICIGDHWAAGESLANLVLRIGEMLSYQSYNVKSPLNGEAAKWVEENKERLPLDTFDFSSMLSVGEAVGRTAEGLMIAGTTCANCGKHSTAGDMQVCMNQHVACPNCALNCPTCNSVICLKCTMINCAVCKAPSCQKCAFKCASCSHAVCGTHQGKCHVCQHGSCSDCLVECAHCAQPTCLEHITKVRREDGTRQILCTGCAPPIVGVAPVKSVGV